MVRRYCEEIDLLRLGSERGGMNALRIAEALGRNTAEGLTLRIDSITSELLVIRPVVGKASPAKPANRC
jgi:hypothetical protein